MSISSEEESIKWLNNFKDTIKQSLVLFDEKLIVKCGNETYNKINTLLNLIENYKKQIPPDKIFYYSEKDYIAKDKIKEFIKKELPDDSWVYYAVDVVDIKRKLEKLLEEK